MLNELLTPPLTKAFGFLNQKDPEEMRTERLELFQSNLELIEELALIEQLLAAEKAKEAEVSLRTCKQTCCLAREYTDGSGSGSGSKKNYGFCSSTCRTAKKSAPQEPQERKASASTGVRRASAATAARASTRTGACVAMVACTGTK